LPQNLPNPSLKAAKEETDTYKKKEKKFKKDYVAF
jgi:hypothetical protein